MGHTCSGIEEMGVGVVDGDIGWAIGEKGGDKADIIDGKGICLELKEETGMPYTIIGLFKIQRDKNGGFAGVELAGEEMGKVQELVVGGEVRTEATLMNWKREMLVKVFMDSTGEDGLKNLAKHRGEANRTVGGGVTGRFVVFEEEEDARGFPRLRIETCMKDDVVKSG